MSVTALKARLCGKALYKCSPLLLLIFLRLSLNRVAARIVEINGQTDNWVGYAILGTNPRFFRSDFSQFSHAHIQIQTHSGLYFVIYIKECLLIEGV